MQKSLEVCHMVLPEDMAESSLIFCHTRMAWCREECNAELEIVPCLLQKLRSIGSYSQISFSHRQNAYRVQYMEEGDFFVFWFGEDALKPHHTQPPQCRIPYCYVTPREDAPGKMTNIELEVQMAATVVSIVRSSQASPSELCRGLQASDTRF